MKAVLFASRWANPVASMTGIGRYMVGLSRALAELGTPAGWRFAASGPREKGTPKWLPPAFGYRPAGWGRAPLRLSWAVLKAPRLEHLIGGFDLVHALHPTTPVPTSQPSVVTFHDLMPIEHPEWYSPVVRWAARRALDFVSAGTQQIIAVSHHTAKQLSVHGGIDPARVTVVHEAVDDRFRQPVEEDRIGPACLSRGLQPGGYVVYVGNVSARKNLVSLVRALADVRDRSLRLLLCGNPSDQRTAVQAEARRLGLQDRVILGGFVPDEELVAIVAAALALVQPSVDEGFGLPTLEAMAIGTPVVASKAGSHPEVLADAALLVDPLDVEGWSEALSRLREDAGLRARLVALGRERAARFSWKRTAERTLAVYSLALGMDSKDQPSG